MHGSSDLVEACFNLEHCGLSIYEATWTIANARHHK